MATVRAAASRSALGLRFWSRLDRAALVEQQALMREILEENGVDLHAAGGVDEAPGMSPSEPARPGLQRSVSALGVAAPRVGPTPEEARLLEPLRPQEFDPYALIETELEMYEAGTRETVFAAIDTWLSSKDAPAKKAPPKKRVAGKWQPPKRGVTARGEPTGEGGNITQADKAAKNRSRVIWIQGGPGAGQSQSQSHRTRATLLCTLAAQQSLAGDAPLHCGKRAIAFAMVLPLCHPFPRSSDARRCLLHCSQRSGRSLCVSVRALLSDCRQICGTLQDCF